MSGIRHFLDLIDIPATDLRQIIDAARVMKAERRGAERPLAGKTLAMIFERPSTRTRVSFEVAMRQLGERFGVERADHDGVDVARQHACGVG